MSTLILLTWPFDDTEFRGRVGDDGVAVVVYARGERVEAGEVVLPGRGEPFRQALTLAVREHDCEDRT
ncbi:hypothetical protein AB0N93_36360 [Streptomyces sp. NPDC091267]|uniref:hypothetical protein n=1 Tax=unclassified Streptomyces TaxID=2593676 RepID=UPI00342209EE